VIESNIVSDEIEITCEVIKPHGSSFDLQPVGHEYENITIFGTPSGKMHRKRMIRGDLVKVRLSGYYAKDGKRPIGLIVGLIKSSTAVPNPDPKQK
jgi:hypothetical protein